MTAFKYYLGLDMGTNSVGWAATDPEYRLLKAKGKDLWGIREFNEASGAVERRTHRISRRRKQREQVRNGILKDYFHDAICEVDPSFFQRLENSKYHEEDKDVEVRYKNNIFNDSNYTDKDYFNEYPTIYHLRNELISSTEKHDVRLVFLALLNMFKHRGHFLNAGLGENNGESNIDNAYFELTELLAFDGENIVGTSGMSFVEKPPYFGCPSGKIGLLSSMFTNPDYRRKGIAKELLSRVVNDAREYGCGTVQITASDMGVKLYTDFGFVHNDNFMQYKI